ncbi:hypothetical protein BDP55DRAFT_197136 [Colletotrichum godetiae]|uniref:Uncharacterized protein n=1 Tax=Colletotrichum godetiae TaxID=1209918 RepID=A0AAJ0EVZ2_9PEZI|nr:uncharacterized protein BDP55DRAFT_197136 [Colletotrichum godetiae]KAK1673704.1 hypothetical protein BDP55DRAFT_197136 [Colletotrichum godetiae]
MRQHPSIPSELPSLSFSTPPTVLSLLRPVLDEPSSTDLGHRPSARYHRRPPA